MKNARKKKKKKKEVIFFKAFKSPIPHPTQLNPTKFLLPISSFPSSLDPLTIIMPLLILLNVLASCPTPKYFLKNSFFYCKSALPVIFFVLPHIHLTISIS